MSPPRPRAGTGLLLSGLPRRPVPLLSAHSLAQPAEASGAAWHVSLLGGSQAAFLARSLLGSAAAAMPVLPPPGVTVPRRPLGRLAAADPSGEHDWQHMRHSRCPLAMSKACWYGVTDTSSVTKRAVPETKAKKLEKRWSG
jgi:hypothetical protein